MEKNQLIKQLAWNSIRSKFGLEGLIQKEDLKAKAHEFDELGASFITLKKDGKLRGCIGSIVARDDLYSDLVNNAKKAAFEDPRFSPLEIDELKDIDLEVSLLTPAVKVEYNDIIELQEKITIGIDGVIIRLGNHQATFLPQVWEELPSFDQFFTHLLLKAGLEVDCFKYHPEIYKYQVEKIK